MVIATILALRFLLKLLPRFKYFAPKFIDRHDGTLAKKSLITLEQNAYYENKQHIKNEFPKDHKTVKRSMLTISINYQLI